MYMYVYIFIYLKRAWRYTTQGLKLCPRSHRLLKCSSQQRDTSFGQDEPQVPQTTQANAIALGYPPEHGRPCC